MIMGMLEKINGLDALLLWGIKPTKYMAEALELATSSYQPNDEDGEQIHILSVVIQDQLDDIEKCIRRLVEEEAAESTDTAKQGVESTE